MSDVVLVFMPYAVVDRPALGLGCLAAQLRQVDISVKVVHAHMMFASRIGLRSFNRLNSSSNLDLLGEWTFAAAAFPDFEPDHDEFFKLLKRPVDEKDREDLFRVRGMTRAFIDELAEQILAEKPKMVGCSSMFQQNTASLALLRRIRELAPEVVTLLGGANCETNVGRALHTHFPWVDYVFSGECDELFPEFCRKMLAPGVLQQPPEERDAWLPDSVFSPLTRPKGLDRPAGLALTHNLDALPIPDFDDYFQDLKTTGMDAKLAPALMIETSRGCWWGEKSRCLFCGLSSGIIGYRSKSPDVAYREIHHLADKYKLNTFELVDNILDMKYFDTLLPRLAEEKTPYRFFYEIKSNITRKQVETMAAAGVRWVQPGIEGLNDRLLKSMRKGNNLCHNLQVLKWCREYGIFVSWNYLCNIPGEQDEWHQEELELVPLLAHLQAPWNSGTPIRYDRFSGYFGTAEKHGLELRPTRTYDYIYPLTEAEKREQAYFFEDVRRQAVNGGREMPIWNQLAELLGQWREVFYTRLEGGGLGDEPAENLPNLTMTPTDDGRLVLEDTRPCAPVPCLELTGLAALVYQLCDKGEGEGSLLTKAKAAGFADATLEDVEAVLRDLLASKTLVEVSGQYLALAVRTPVRPYLTMDPSQH